MIDPSDFIAPDISDPLHNRTVGTDYPHPLAGDMISYRLVELQCSPIQGAFDTAHLQNIHHYLHHDLYDWAGELRSVDLHNLPVSDLERSVDRIQQAVDTASSYYTLTYVPGIKRDGPNDYRHIRVTVHRPNLVATTREGYYSGANQAPEQGRAGADAAADDASRNHLSYAALEVHILSVSTSTAGAPSKCIVSVKTGDLAWQYSNDGARSVKLVLAAETFDGKHAQASYAKSPVTLSQSAADIAKGADVVTSFSVPVRIPAQAASLRLVLVDGSSGRVGSDETPLLHSTPQP